MHKTLAQQDLPVLMELQEHPVVSESQAKMGTLADPVNLVTLDHLVQLEKE